MSNEIDNLEFWKEFEKTDPKQTKDATVGGQHRTAVDAQYKKKQITKAFGMFGLNWGVEPESEKYERVHFEGSTCILYYNAIAFYKYKGELARFPIAAAIKEAYVTKGGQGYLKIDDEAYKKVRTDALTKGFTDLGFNADIHMGKFDDQNYVLGAQAAAEIKEQEDNLEVIKGEKKEIRKWFDNQIKSVLTISTKESRDKAFNKVLQGLKTRGLASGINVNQLINELEEARKNAK